MDETFASFKALQTCVTVSSSMKYWRLNPGPCACQVYSKIFHFLSCYYKWKCVHISSSVCLLLVIKRLLNLSSSTLLLHCYFTAIRTSFFGFPTQTEDQKFSGNPPGFQNHIGAAETFSLVD